MFEPHCLPVNEIVYGVNSVSHRMDYSYLLRSGNKANGVIDFHHSTRNVLKDPKQGMECLDTIFSLPTLLCACTIKCKNI